MASGHDRDMREEAVDRDPREPVRGFLLVPPDQPPGTVFAYSQPCTYALAAVIQRTAGMRLSEYLRPRLLDPLGIGPVAWQRDASGRQLGYSGLHATTDAIARLVKDGVDIDCTIIGDGSLRAVTKRWVEDNNLSGSVHLAHQGAPRGIGRGVCAARGRRDSVGRRRRHVPVLGRWRAHHSGQRRP